MKPIKKLLPIALLFFLSYWAVKPLFIKGFFPIHDDTQVARVYEMHKSIADGMFPVRWVADLGYGYGYPIFNFYAPLAYYIGGFFTFFLDPLAATKLMMVVGIVISGIVMYFFARDFWGDRAGIIAGLLYLYAPFHAVDIFVRGDVAEFWAYAFIPLAFLGVYKVFLFFKSVDGHEIENAKLHLKTKKSLWHWVILGATGYAAIILSHNLTAMIATPFLFLFAIILYVFTKVQQKSQTGYFVFLPILFGILIGAFYWLPALAEIGYTNVSSQIGGGADYHDHFVCLNQLWDSPWGFGGSTKGCVDGLSLKIGKEHIILAVLCIGALYFLWKKKKFLFSLVIAFFVFFLLSIFLMLEQSVSIWDFFSPMAFLQYPWRFLILASFFSSFLSGGGVWFLEQVLMRFVSKNSRVVLWIFVFIIIIASIAFNAKVFTPQTIFGRSASDYVNQFTLKWTTSLISDEYMLKGFRRPKNPQEIPRSRLTYNPSVVVTSSISEKTQSIMAQVDASKKNDILVNVAYFPAWHVFIDGKSSQFRYFGGGILVTMPQGDHSLAVKFIQTWVERIGDMISFCGVCLLILGIMILQGRAINEHKKT